MKIPDIEVIKDIPGYKIILKAVLKSQIQQLVEQIASETDEETVVLSANLSDGSISYHGSESGKSFLDTHDEFKSQFLGFCLKRLHKKSSEQRQKQQDGLHEASVFEYASALQDYHNNSSEIGFNSKRFNRTLRHEPYRRGRGRGNVPQFRASSHISPNVHNSDSANNITIKMEHESDTFGKVGASLGAMETRNSLSQSSEPFGTSVGDKQTIPGSYLDSSTSANEHVPSADTYSEQSQTELNSSQLEDGDGMSLINIKQECSNDSESDIKITGMELPSAGYMQEDSFPEGVALLDNSQDMNYDAVGAMGATSDVHSKQRFPKVIGVIDGTQIRIKGPNENEPDFVNRKGFHSINVQMVCDARFRITNVVAKWPGSVHDSRIFRESELCRKFENGEIDGLLLGDSGYPCKPFLMTPYMNPQTTVQERFNSALTRTRVIIEQTFGVIKRRFPCLSYGLRMKTKNTPQAIVSCVVLHNFGMESGDTFERNVNTDLDLPDIHGDTDQAGARCRDVIAAKYFA